MNACWSCGTETERQTVLVFTPSLSGMQMKLGAVREHECLDCRQSRVAAQVAAGLRPASDLES